MDKRSSRDLLSNLPLGVIHTILEHVPITDAVRTCILSKEWRYKWVTLPHLTFDAQSLTSSPDFIYQVLLLHQGPILKFKLNFQSMTISQNLNPLLIFLSRNGIRVLILRCPDLDPVIFNSIYSCQNLTHLELLIYDFPPPPPTFKGFLSLRRLVLHCVYLSSNTIHSLLSGLPLLEEIELMVINQEMSGWALDLRLHVPNLKILRLKGDFQDICLNAPLLSHMCVHFKKHVAPGKYSVSTYTELLGSITTLEELKGNRHFFEFLSIGIESCHTPLVFPHLRFIQLNPEVFYDKKVEMVIAHLCKGAPNLHKIRVSYRNCYHWDWRSDSECPFNFTFEWLKVIEFESPEFNHGSQGMDSWMKLIKCLLARSPALETMICERPDMGDRRLLELSSTLLTYPRASPNAKICFKKI